MKKANAMRTALCLALVSLLSTACEDQETGLVIIGMVPLKADDGCEFRLENNEFLGRGTIDLALRRNYVIAPLVENRLQDIRNINGYTSGDGRLDPGDITLTSATIEYTALDQITASLPGALTVPISHTVSNDGGSLIASLEVLTPAMTDALRQSEEFLVLNSFNEFVPVTERVVTIIARLRLKGATLDGKEVESNEFLFPIDLCLGCLVNVPAQLAATNCESIPMGFTPEQIACPGAIGTEALFVDCLVCQPIANRIFGDLGLARQVCLPNP